MEVRTPLQNQQTFIEGERDACRSPDDSGTDAIRIWRQFGCVALLGMKKTEQCAFLRILWGIVHGTS